MLSFLKRRKANELYAAPLAIHSGEGASLYAFTPEVVSNFRHMLTGLLYNGQLPPRVSVLASLRGEGVSFTTLALATTLASDTSKRVCAVELNWWAPGMAAHLAGEKKPTKTRGRSRKEAASESAATPTPQYTLGLADVIGGTASLDDALIKTAMPNLAFLPAGDLAIERRPVVARSEVLQKSLDELNQRFDHILFDIPAVLATSDAIALASYADACCLVVRQGVTPSTQIKAALDDIKHLQVLGVVLNQVSLKTPRWIRTFIPQE